MEHNNLANMATCRCCASNPLVDIYNYIIHRHDVSLPLKITKSKEKAWVYPLKEIYTCVFSVI